MADLPTRAGEQSDVIRGQPANFGRAAGPKGGNSDRRRPTKSHGVLQADARAGAPRGRRTIFRSTAKAGTTLGAYVAHQAHFSRTGGGGAPHSNCGSANA